MGESGNVKPGSKQFGYAVVSKVALLENARGVRAK